MRWLMDCGPLVILAREAREAWRWPGHTLEVVREVYEETHEDWNGQRLLGYTAADGRPWVRVHDLDVMGPAAAYLFGHLRPSPASATKNLGEDASIALCAKVDPDLVFVSLDNHAVFTALAELGPGRVVTPFDVWADLYQRGLLSPDTHQRLIKATLKQRQNLPGLPDRLTSTPPIAIAGGVDKP